MIKTICICLLALGLTACSSPAIDRLTEKNGYKDLWLEMPMDTFLSKVKAEKSPEAWGLVICRITDSNYLKIGGCKLDVGWAYFFNGKLLRLQTSGLGNYDCLLATYVHLFGPPSQADSTLKKNFWLGNNAEAELALNPNMGFTNIRLTSKKIDAEYGRFCKKRKWPRYAAHCGNASF